MSAPINTYNSQTNLNLGQVPTDLESETLYRDLLDIHNALEILLTSSDDGDALFQAFIDKQRAVTDPITDVSYNITTLNGTVLLDASLNSVTANLPTAVGFKGYLYTVKCIDDTFGAFVDTLEASETLEEETAPFELFKGEYIDITSDGVNWRVMM